MKRTTPKRLGSTAVETAMVLIVYLPFMLAICEYGRMLMVRQLMENGTREGARYAVVHSLDSSVESDATAVVRSKMAGQDQHLTGNGTVTVFKSDASGNNAGVPGDAKFGEYIAVRMVGTYQPMFSSMFFLNQNITLDIRTTMTSEAN